MVDVEKLTDAEIRTKLLEFGFPVMPITGTTRRIMMKKLKMLLENQNKISATDGRKSLGKYSSEEESETETKAKKTNKRRVTTLGVPVSSSQRSTRQTFHLPETVNGAPKKAETRTTTLKTTTTTSSTRSQNLVNIARDDYGTDSDSESEITSKVSQHEQKSKLDGTNLTFNGIDLKDVSPDSSRLYPQLPLSSRNFSSSSNSSVLLPSSPGVSGSVASEYAAEKLNQIRSRYSLGSPGGDRSTYASASSGTNLEEEETPFLSNFTKRLSALNSSRKQEFDYRNDGVKEHDTNGPSTSLAYGGRSYLSSFKPKTRNTDYFYRSSLRDNDNIGGNGAGRSGDNDGKNYYVSFAVLAGVALFFVVIGFVYLGMRPDTSIVTSGFITPFCHRNNDGQYKIGFECIEENQVENTINLLNVIKPELNKRAISYECSNTKNSKPPQMTEDEIVTFCHSHFKTVEIDMIRNDLRNLEIMLFSNPEWGINLAQKIDNNDAVSEEDIVTNIKVANENRDGKTTSLIILNPELPYKCSLYKQVASLFYVILSIGIILVGLLIIVWLYKKFRFYQQKRKDEVNYMVERIIEILQNAASESFDSENYVVINHVRDMILNVKERKNKQKYWDEAVKYINENESRVRTEVQTVQGEPFDVWRWIGNTNLSMSGSTTDFKYHSGRRLVDVKYLINETLKFPHRRLFFCQSSNDIEIKNEIREGLFSIYILQCRRCKREHAVCSEDPNIDLLDVNVAFVAGIVSLGYDLYQLNEICNALHLPGLTRNDFQRYLSEIHNIYNGSKKQQQQQQSSENDKLSNDSGFNSHDNCSIVTSTPNRTRTINAEDSLENLDFNEIKENFLAELSKDLDQIEFLTRDQQDSEFWYNERRKRLTASNFGRICKLMEKTNRTNTVNSLLYSNFRGNVYTRYGQENEMNAIKDFEKLTGKIVTKCGLVVHKDYPYLAASPDGIIHAEDALIEVKCPYKASSSTVAQAVGKKEIQFATYENGVFKLKRDDKYYYQVQGQLFATRKLYCYFIVWTPKDLAYERIDRDADTWNEMLPKLKNFYFDHMLPEILRNIYSPTKSVWQGQAFETYPGSANQLAYSPTPCLKIRGMINEDSGLSGTAAQEALLAKVAHRCKILHCKAEPTSGCIYLKCGDAQDAAIAFKNLHGWWYSGQLVTVKYLRLERYQQRYPDAPSGPPYLISTAPLE